jgi:hypothetical protein
MPYLWHAYYETVFTLLLENGWREACERHGREIETPAQGYQRSLHTPRGAARRGTRRSFIAPRRPRYLIGNDVCFSDCAATGGAHVLAHDFLATPRWRVDDEAPDAEAAAAVEAFVAEHGRVGLVCFGSMRARGVVEVLMRRSSSIAPRASPLRRRSRGPAGEFSISRPRRLVEDPAELAACGAASGDSPRDKHAPAPTRLGVGSAPRAAP